MNNNLPLKIRSPTNEPGTRTRPFRVVRKRVFTGLDRHFGTAIDAKT